MQPWEFLVVDDRELLTKLANSKETGGAKACATASHAIILLAKPDASGFQELNIGICAENLVLESTHLNIGSLIIGVYPNAQAQKVIKTAFKIPEEHTAYLMVALGYPTESLPPNNHWFEEKVHRNQF